MVITAALSVAGALLAWTTILDDVLTVGKPEAGPSRPQQPALWHCGIEGPPSSSAGAATGTSGAR